MAQKRGDKIKRRISPVRRGPGNNCGQNSLILLPNRNKYEYVRQQVTSKGRLYGGLDEAGQELSGLWFLRQP